MKKETIKMIKKHQNSIVSGRTESTKKLLQKCIELMEKGIYEYADVRHHKGYYIQAYKDIDIDRADCLSLSEANKLLKANQ